MALASLMLIPAILVSWESVTERPGAFYGLLFLLQGAAIGAFLSFDVILFYIFFELTLIPAFFLIGRWGTAPAAATRPASSSSTRWPAACSRWSA